MIKVKWASIKSMSQTKNISLNYVEYPRRYVITLNDNGYIVTCILKKNGQSELDFEQNFKSLANRPQTMRVTLI